MTNPTSLDFGALDFGALGRGQAGTQLFEMHDAPATSQLTASATGDGPVFSVGRLVVRRMVGQVPVDPGELPPGHKGKPPEEDVWEQVGESDGRQPVAAQAGDILDV